VDGTEARRAGAATRVWFDHAQGLVFRGDPAGFEIAGADRRFAPARARIDGETVVVEGTAKHLRYARSDNFRAVLCNGEGLPASPFVTEVR
jgi:sialate O-acetylesterase